MKLTAAACLALAAASPTWSTDVEKWINAGLESGERVGGVVATIDPSGVSYHPFGRRSVASADTVNQGTRFEIGSITKVFTNLLLAETVAAGEVSYETNLSEVLPELDFSNPAVGEVTLQELATHTSGLPRLPANLLPQDPANPYAEYDADQLLDGLATTRESGRLAKRYAYSNFGVGALGYVLGKVDGRGYETALNERVLAKLGSHTLTVGCSDGDAVGHADGSDTSYWDLASLAGAGGLCPLQPGGHFAQHSHRRGSVPRVGG